MRRICNTKGFSLPELMVAMVAALVVMAGIYAAYYSQQKSYILQDQVAQMQRNLRMAIYYMEREIRMAGCDPKGTADAGILDKSVDSIDFTMDVNGDGQINGGNEHITYYLDLEDGALKRNNQVITQTLARNIDSLNFVYFDEDGFVTADTAQISSVQIALLAKTDRGDPGFKDTSTYDMNGDGDFDDPEDFTAPGDNSRRRLLMTLIRCRNLPGFAAAPGTETLLASTTTTSTTTTSTTSTTAPTTSSTTSWSTSSTTTSTTSSTAASTSTTSNTTSTMVHTTIAG